jgi:predicted nuclease of predicted toxin-antitoxin system
LKLLLDEMYSAMIAEQLRSRGYDVVSIHDSHLRVLEGAPDEEVFAAAVTQGRSVVTENVPDFRRLETAALADGAPCPGLIYTTNRQFPRGDAATAGRMVIALAALLADPATVPQVVFLKRLSE